MSKIRFWLFNILAGFLAALTLPGVASYLFPAQTGGAYGTLMTMGLLGLMWSLFSVAMAFASPRESTEPSDSRSQQHLLEDWQRETLRLERDRALQYQYLLADMNRERQRVTEVPQQPTVIVVPVVMPTLAPSAPQVSVTPRPALSAGTVEGQFRELPAGTDNPRVKVILGQRFLLTNDNEWYHVETGDVYDAKGILIRKGAKHNE